MWQPNQEGAVLEAAYKTHVGGFLNNISSLKEAMEKADKAFDGATPDEYLRPFLDIPRQLTFASPAEVTKATGHRASFVIDKGYACLVPVQTDR